MQRSASAWDVPGPGLELDVLIATRVMGWMFIDSAGSRIFGDPNFRTKHGSVAEASGSSCPPDLIGVTSAALREFSAQLIDTQAKLKIAEEALTWGSVKLRAWAPSRYSDIGMLRTMIDEALAKIRGGK